MQYYCCMAFYRLKKSIRAHKVVLFDPRSDGTCIEAGEIVEAISAPNQNGLIMIRHCGRCYRAWKEELQNAHIAERLPARELASG
jgi:hypothetical protein